MNGCKLAVKTSLVANMLTKGESLTMVMVMIGVRFGSGSQGFVVVKQGVHAHTE